MYNTVQIIKRRLHDGKTPNQTVGPKGPMNSGSGSLAPGLEWPRKTTRRLWILGHVIPFTILNGFYDGMRTLLLEQMKTRHIFQS